MENNSESYEERIKRQTDLVKKLADEDRITSSDETKLQLRREIDALRHLILASEGEPKERSRRAAEFARDALLSRAITPTPPED
jgi:hypothetical protein